MRCEYEWFAEAYATFYANADMPGTELGSLVKDKDPSLHKRMLNTVHPKDDFASVTNQGDVGIFSALEEEQETEANKQPDQNPVAQSKEGNAPSSA